MHKKDNNEKRLDISLLRICATLSVILLHTCNTLTDNNTVFQLTRKQFIFFNVIVDMCTWAVPVFIMMTGILLLREDKEITWTQTITKYIKRVILALLVFGIPFSIMELVAMEKTIRFSMLGTAFLNVLSGNVWGHLWYLYMLIGLYAILPLVKVFINHTSRKEQKHFLMVLFCFNFLFPFLGDLLDFEFGFNIPVASFSLFYLLLGKYLDGYKGIKITRYMKVIILLIIAGIIIGINVLFYKKALKIIDYTSPIIVCLAICIFLIFKDLNTEKYKENYVWHIDRLCFCVYLIHPVFINFMYKFLGYTPLTFRYYPVLTFGFWGIYVVCSFLSAEVLFKIRPLRKYIL